LVATEWPRTQALNFKSSVFLHKPTSCAGTYENVVRQLSAVMSGPFQHFVFHVVVSNKGYALFRWAFNVHHDCRRHLSSVTGCRRVLDSLA
jgi:hypothetical protein